MVLAAAPGSGVVTVNVTFGLGATAAAGDAVASPMPDRPSKLAASTGVMRRQLGPILRIGMPPRGAVVPALW
jgi:hypothetical protein